MHVVLFIYLFFQSPINELISGWSVRLCWWKCAVRMTCHGQRGHLFGFCSFDTTFMFRDAIDPTYCLRVSGTIFFFCHPTGYCTTSLRVGCPTDTCTPLAHLQITCKLNLVLSLNTEWKKKVTSHPFPPPVSLAPWQPHDEEKRSCSSWSLSLMVRLLV